MKARECAARGPGSKTPAGFGAESQGLYDFSGWSSLFIMTIQSFHEGARMRGVGSGVEDLGGVWGGVPRSL
jgi:hypothetical protein